MHPNVAAIAAIQPLVEAKFPTATLQNWSCEEDQHICADLEDGSSLYICWAQEDGYEVGLFIKDDNDRLVFEDGVQAGGFSDPTKFNDALGTIGQYISQHGRQFMNVGERFIGFATH